MRTTCVDPGRPSAQNARAPRIQGPRRRQVSGRRGHEHLARLRLAHHPRADMHGHPAHPSSSARPRRCESRPESADRCALRPTRSSTAPALRPPGSRIGRAAVTGGVDQRAAVAPISDAAHLLVVLHFEPSPCGVAYSCDDPGRIDDVGEHDGRERPPRRAAQRPIGDPLEVDRDAPFVTHDPAVVAGRGIEDVARTDLDLRAVAILARSIGRSPGSRRGGTRSVPVPAIGRTCVDQHHPGPASPARTSGRQR